MRNTDFQQRRKGKLIAVFLLTALFAASVVVGVSGWRRFSTLDANSSSVTGETAIEQLKHDGSYNSLAAAMAAAQYQINQQGNRWLAGNPAQQFNASFTDRELRIADWVMLSRRCEKR